MTATQITGYLKDTYDECKHDAYAMSIAINNVSKELNYDDKWKLFHLLVENEPIDELHTHSYGFHTSNGRHIIETIKEHYNKIIYPQ